MGKELLSTSDTAVEHGDVAAPIKEGPGIAALQALLKQGVPSVKAVIDIVDANRGEHDAIFKLLQSTLGNKYVQETVGAMAALRASIPRKEVVAGDPGNPGGGFFLGSVDQKSAEWSTRGGGFTGRADEKGLDTTVRLDPHNNLRGKYDLAGGEGSVGLERDGKTVVEGYAKPREYGLRGGAITVGADGTLTPTLRHRDTDTGGVTEAIGAYQDPHTTATGTVGVRREDGVVVASLEGERQFGDRTKVTGSAKLDDQGHNVTVSGEHKLTASTTLTGTGMTSSAGHRLDAGVAYNPDEKTSITATGHTGTDGWDVAGTASHQYGTDSTFSATGNIGSAGWNLDAQSRHRLSPSVVGTGSLTASPDAYRAAVGAEYTIDPKTQLTGSLVRTQDSTTATLSGSHTGDALKIAGQASYVKPDGGPGQAELKLTESYQSPTIIQTAEVAAGAGASNYLRATASIDAQLAPSLYGGSWGSVGIESGKQTTGSIGASLTFTPSEKTALTLAGVMNQAGQLEARLQLDVFKQRVSTISELSQAKKDALFSVFVSVGQGSGLDSRFGAAQNTFGDSGSQFKFGVSRGF